MVLLSLLLAAQAAPAADDAASKPRPALEKLNLEKAGLAIEGYDPVAYFPEGGAKPKRGDKRLETVHRGVRYRFASAANRALFLATPTRYEPAYGGWCAWAMADGEAVEIDPKSFLVQDGELLLFYDGLFADTHKRWRKGDGAALKVKADRHWSRHYGHPDRDLGRFALIDGIALGGHDPMAFRGPAGRAVEGAGAIAYTYRGVTYRFVDAASRERFRRDPAGFEAGFGGWDPVRLAAGERVAGKAAHFLVHGERLLLFADAEAKAAFLAAPETTLAALRPPSRESEGGESVVAASRGT
jgi:YHS domain-containing protein